MKAILLSLALAACGGGGGFAPEPSAPVSAPLVVPGKTLVTLYGDSTQRGGTVSAASVAQSILGPLATLTNEGVGGSAAWHLQAGTERQLPTPLHDKPFAAVADASAANVMAFRFGINDAQMYSPENFRELMASLIASASAGGKRRVIIETPNQVWIEPHRSLMPPLVAVLRALAVGHVLCDHYAAPSSAADTTDGVHPTAAAYAVQGAALAVCVEQAIQKASP